MSGIIILKLLPLGSTVNGVSTLPVAASSHLFGWKKMIIFPILMHCQIIKFISQGMN